MSNIVNKVIKCVTIGDPTVGKTCMLWTYSTNCFPDGYVPTVLDKYTVDLPVGKDVYKLILFDTAGQEEYDRLRIMTYPNTDVVLICFSVVEPESLENVQSVWYPEVKKYLPNTPFVLVGTKIDLRYNIDEIKRLKLQKREPVSYDTAMQIAQKMGAIGYVECSALTQKGLSNVLNTAITTVISKQKQKKDLCILM